MKKVFLVFVFPIIIFGCSRQNPNPNNNTTPTSTSVTICNQVWTTKNLDVDHYRNGDRIPEVPDLTQWNSLTTGAWCWYMNDSARYWHYGKYYNWYAVNDPRGLAPIGWHVPSNNEWNILIKCIDPNSDTSISTGTQSSSAGGALKETSTNYWGISAGVTNSTGFTALPGGIRGTSGLSQYQGLYGMWWSTTISNDPTVPWGIKIHTLFSATNEVFSGYAEKNHGLPIRCIKD